jgi:3-phosphoshikimate 1-carboxyvinyltransferase
MRVEPGSRLEGVIQVPGDKSISHRHAILAAMGEGRSRIDNFSSSADCQSTLGCIAAMGARVDRQEAAVVIESPGWRALSQPSGPLDAGNSGTTIRLLSGLLAALPMVSTIFGDESLNRRPMGRVVTPLTRMGAQIEARDGEFPPLRIRGTDLRPISYALPVASAQVKTCVLLAGLTARGQTTVIEPTPTRDHTERVLPLFGAPVEKAGGRISVSGPAHLRAAELLAAGDLSSAFFFIVAAMVIPGSSIELKGVGTNPTRSALLDLLTDSGAPIVRKNPRTVSGEPICDLLIESSQDHLRRFPSGIGGQLIPNLIDELPIIAVLGTRLPGGLTVKDAGELRKKESDRIHSVVENMRAVGVAADEAPDGFHIPYTPEIRGGPVRTFGDHRIAMAFSVLGLISQDGVELDDPECAAVSFPGFYDVLRRVVLQ